MTHSFQALDRAFDLAKDEKYDEALSSVSVTISS